RVLAVWPISDPRVEALVSGPRSPVPVPPDAVVALADDGGRPVPGRADAATVLIAVPEDVERLRRTDPGLAKSWRYAVRETLDDMLAEGRKVIGFHDKSYYVVEKARRSLEKNYDGSRCRWWPRSAPRSAPRRSATCCWCGS